MENFLKKGVLAGLGLISMTKEKVEEVVDDLIKRGELTQDDRSQFIKDTMDKVDQHTQEAKTWVNTQVEEAWEKIKPKSVQQLDSIQTKLDALSAEIQTLKEKLNQQ